MDHRKLGVHLSISNGLHNALIAAKKLNINALQIFLKNPSRWNGKDYSEDEIARYLEIKNTFDDLSVFAHSGYLINLAGQDDIRKRSIDAVIDEMTRADMLGIQHLVIHPGSHRNDGIDTGITRVIESLTEIFDKSHRNITILLETTSGQGSSIGFKMQHLSRIIHGSTYENQLGICIDTCHVFTAGYDIASTDGFDKFKTELVSESLVDKCALIHLNDSKREAGTHIDRHEHIGKGFIGNKGFTYLLKDKDFQYVPLILETPKNIDGRKKKFDDLYADRINLEKVRKLLAVKAQQ